MVGLTEPGMEMGEEGVVMTAFPVHLLKVQLVEQCCIQELR